jgi:hypothetical protein
MTDRSRALEAALRPFAEFAERFGDYARDDDWQITRNPSGTGNLTMGDVRRARALLALHSEGGREDNSSAAGAAPFDPAARDVLAERERQKSAEGWTLEHDDAHGDGSMARAAAAYALYGLGFSHIGIWPWGPHWWKPRSHRENLVRAGALILAEIERLDRAEGDVAGEKAGITQEK